MGDPDEGAPAYWDSQTDTLDEARQAVWSVPEDRWEPLTAECVQVIRDRLPGERHHLLDVGCGMGRLTVPLALAYPEATVVGIDPAKRMLAHARSQVEAAGLAQRISLVPTVGSAVDDLGPFDGAWTVVVLQHNQREVCAATVASVGRALGSGGRFVYQLVSDVDFEDYGHVPESVATGWALDAGLKVVDVTHAAVFPDWLWITAERPA